MSAKGFTFSSPTIQVKLTQEAPPTPTPSPTPVATQAPPTIDVAAPVVTQTTKPALAKKTTITCVKGKLIKKVTAVTPVCPKGYKKK